MAPWLVVSGRKDTRSGKYFTALDKKSLHKSANDQRVQEEFPRNCEEVSGVSFLKFLRLSEILSSVVSYSGRGVGWWVDEGTFAGIQSKI